MNNVIEAIIQISITTDNKVIVLTNYGRIFIKGSDDWVEIQTPYFGDQ